MYIILGMPPYFYLFIMEIYLRIFPTPFKYISFFRGKILKFTIF
jgi:hypothetical protein